MEIAIYHVPLFAPFFNVLIVSVFYQAGGKKMKF